MKSTTSFLHSISEARPFLDNWHPLLAYNQLYVPIYNSPYLSSELSSESELFEWIDISSREMFPGFRVADVFLSPESKCSGLQLHSVSSVVLLKRLLKNSMLQGVCFHPGDEGSSYTLYRFAVARLVGLLEIRDTENPNIKESPTELVGDDRLCLALYLAAQARESGSPPEIFFTAEIDSLLGLGLYEHACTYLSWASTLRMPDDTAYQAHLRSVIGDPGGLVLLQAAAELSWREQLEYGRSLLIAGRAREALYYFTRCLEKSPDHFDPLLGMGIGLRTCGWDRLHSPDLELALRYFERVTEKCGYHEAEALHHQGTIYMAKEDYQRAESMFRGATSLATSPVSKRNLALVLHAQGRIAESYREFSYLFRFFPDQAAGLEKYFKERPRLVMIAGEPAVYMGDIGAQISRIGQTLRNYGILLKGDILDFKRVDAYINYYAPGGAFISHSKLSQLSSADLSALFGDLARHLAHTLVASGNAYWGSAAYAPPEQLQVVMANAEGQPQVFSLFRTLVERLKQGAETDSMLVLESIIANTPEYLDLAKEFSDPFPALPADEDRVALFENRAAQAPTILEEYGFLLRGTLDDLRVLDEVVDAMLARHTTLADACAVGRFTNEDVLTLGLYLGSICRRSTVAVWYDHHDGFGISLQEMPIANLYPIWRLFKRIESGPGGDGYSNLSTLQPSLVCAELIRHAQDEGITSFATIRSLVTERLPLITESQAVDSLCRTILYCATKQE